LQDRAGEQACTDQARSARERLLAVVEHVDERAFADSKPERIGEQLRNTLERYCQPTCELMFLCFGRDSKPPI